MGMQTYAHLNKHTIFLSHSNSRSSKNYLGYKSPFHHSPIDNLPQCLQVGRPTVLVVEVVCMFPNVEGKKGAEPVGDRVIGAGVLADGQCAGRIRLEPDPARAEEGGAFLHEFSLEGVEAPPLFDDLGYKGRFLDSGFAFARNDSGRAFARNDLSRPELRKVEIVIQDLTRIIKDRTGGMADDVLQGHGLERCASNEFIQVVHIPFQVLAMMEFEGPRTNDRFQCVYRVR